MEDDFKMIAFTEDGLSLDRYPCGRREETVWLTQAEIAELFGIERSVVLYHLRTIYKNEELSEEATFIKIVQVQTEGKRTVKRERPIYNLDAILSAGDPHRAPQCSDVIDGMLCGMTWNDVGTPLGWPGGQSDVTNVGWVTGGVYNWGVWAYYLNFVPVVPNA